MLIAYLCSQSRSISARMRSVIDNALELALLGDEQNKHVSRHLINILEL
jgi:hypothetical protein